MPLYTPPPCPRCNSRDVRLVKSPVNLVRVALAVVCAMLTSADPVRLKWKCIKDGRVFRASGTHA